MIPCIFEHHHRLFRVTDRGAWSASRDEVFVIAGQVVVLSAGGEELTSLADDGVFGEIALLRNVPRTATVRTTVDTLLLVLSREVFLSAVHADLSPSERAAAPGPTAG